MSDECIDRLIFSERKAGGKLHQRAPLQSSLASIASIRNPGNDVQKSLLSFVDKYSINNGEDSCAMDMDVDVDSTADDVDSDFYSQILADQIVTNLKEV